MTEAEWNATTDPTEMLEFLQGKVSDRKLRLFASSCCRKLWHLMGERRAPQSVEVVDDIADGHVGIWKLRGLRAQLEPHLRHSMAWHSNQALNALLHDRAGVAARDTMSAIINFRFVYGASLHTALERDAERTRLIGCLRDIFSNVFHTFQFDPSWRTSTTHALSCSMYASRDFTAAPILADALEDAGCEDPAILEHLRGENRHVRGCWVVDAVLGKE